MLSAADFYLSPDGADTNPGSREKPWRMLNKANETHFQAADRLLFQGGATFAGTLKVPADRMVVTSFGTGTAVINGGNGRAISIDGANHVEIRNLRLIGSGRKSGNTESGLYLAHSVGSIVDHVEVSGFRRSGVEINGAQDARITFVHAHENGFAGISSGGDTSKNLYIGDCLVENNPGDPTIKANHSGNGIVVSQAAGALIERCEARYNGWDMVWTGNGPVGIWTYQSDKVVIQYCVSHHNRSTGSDGGGFDLDGGVTNSLVQYNYSHDNYGAGYLICQYAGAGRFENNTVRYNISQDDGLKDHNAGIFVWVGGEGMKSSLVHNNTIFNNKGSAVAIAFAKKYENLPVQFDFYNNIFVSLAEPIRGAAKGRFAGNLYWSMGSRAFRVDAIEGFDKWVSTTGQERAGDRVAGCFSDPLLAKDGPGLVNEPAKLPTLHEYLLLSGSPATAMGLDLKKQFGIDPGERDFYGNRLAGQATWSVGAHQASQR